jgi:signal transduction histidine kinase
LPPEVLEELNICKDQIKRIVAIAENLKQISRVNNQKMVIADINNVIAQIMSLYATQFKIEEIEVEVHYQAHLPETMMDKEKISQVLQNLISNAMVSMEGIKNKRLKITTEEDLLIGHHDRLKIMVADTGVGIEEEYMSHIFDPFFTTKEQGKGTGLGLSISYGIIKEHGGKIWAENNEWGGASFFIELPVRID